MANIKKIEGKTGISYKITVTSGRDLNGKQMRHFLTWKPPKGVTARQTEKEVQKVAFEFEQKIEAGFAVDNRQTFAEYAEYVIDLKERSGKKRRTIDRYRELMDRINPAIGHFKLTELRPQHLNIFYKNLGEAGIRKNGSRATAKECLRSTLENRKISGAKLAEMSGVSPTTARSAIRGESVSLKSADKIAASLKLKTKELFEVTESAKPLANKTILEYHRLISTILAQAEKEMLVLFNAASKATPPKTERKEAETFQPEEMEIIIDQLEKEPLKWQVLAHLLIVTGMRRGEVAGLEWSKIDWDHNQLLIDKTLLYSHNHGLYEDTTKTGVSRFIKLPEETMDLLRRYRRYWLELRMKNGDRWKNTDFLFVRDDGSPMHPDSITAWVERFGARCGLDRSYPHKFRHSMASLLFFNGADSVSVSKRLGHAKVSTTTDIYSHLIKQADERASECIADVLLRKGTQKTG